MNFKRLLWSAGMARSLVEAITLGVVVIVGLASLHEQMTSTALARGLMLGVTVAPALLALRARVITGNWPAVLVREALAGLILSLAVTLAVLSASSLLGTLGILAEATGGLLVTTILFVGTGLLYLGMRLVGVRTWLYWDRLRTRRLLWGLVHAHLSVVAVAVLVLVLSVSLVGLLTGSLFLQNEPPPSGPLSLGLSVIILVLFPALWTAALLTLVGITVVLAPSAVASYFVARRATGRLEELARATNQLRAGDYDVRVPVRGEDEIAQLQADFNAMAADLGKAQADLATERDRVAALLQSRRELVATVSHELRTPVAIIRGYVESSLRRGEGTIPLALRADLETVDREAGQLQRLIDDLFALSRAEVGQLALECLPTDLETVVNRVVQAMSSLAWQSGRVSLVAEAATEGLPQARVDASRLEQMLANLVHNAIRHTPPGGIVAVLARAGKPGEVVVEVRDTGEGIAPTDLPYVFERFYRGERQPEGDRGAGLGLALVKELAEAMGGRVSVASEPGKGSSFQITLPSA